MADINQIINYIMKTPTNSNWNVLSTLLGDGDWSQLKAYVETTPKNMNRQVLRALLGNGSSTTSLILDTTAEFTSMSWWAMLRYNYNILEGVDSITAETITVTLDGTTVELPRIIDNESSIITYGENGGMGPSFSNYPVNVVFSTVEGYQNITIYTKSTGTHSIKIVVNQPGISPVITN